MSNHEIKFATDELGDENQHLTFLVGKNMFAIAILNIREIIELTAVTKVPQMQSYIAGITNVRGKIIPVIDLHERFGFGKIDASCKTCIIVETKQDNENVEIGLVISTVDQVYPVNNNNTEETPMFGSVIKKEYVKEYTKIGDGFVPILELSSLLSLDELSANIYNEEFLAGMK